MNSCEQFAFEGYGVGREIACANENAQLYERIIGAPNFPSEELLHEIQALKSTGNTIGVMASEVGVQGLEILLSVIVGMSLIIVLVILAPKILRFIERLI